MCLMRSSQYSESPITSLLNAVLPVSYMAAFLNKKNYQQYFLTHLVARLTHAKDRKARKYEENEKD